MMFVFQTAGLGPPERNSPDRQDFGHQYAETRESTPEEEDDDRCSGDHWDNFHIRDFIVRNRIKPRRVREFNSLVNSLKKNSLKLKQLSHSFEDDEDTNKNVLQVIAPKAQGSPDYSMIQGSHATPSRPFPTQVFVRVLFLKMGEIQTIKERYSAEVYVESRWREPTLDDLTDEQLLKLDWKTCWNPQLFLENALGPPREINWKVPHRIEGDGVWVVQKQIFRGTFAETLELWDFPFDVQDLSVTVTTAKSMEEVEIIENETAINAINRDDFVDEQEWTLYQHIEVSRRVVYHTYSTPPFEQVYLTFMTRAARRLGFFYWHVFLIMFLITVLAFTTFSVDPRIPERRLQLSFLLILTSVNFKFMVQESLPRIPYLTYLDKYLLTCIFILGVVSFWHAVSATILSVHPTPIAEWRGKEDLRAFYCVGVIYILFHVLFAINVNRNVMSKRREMEDCDENYREHIRELIVSGKTSGEIEMIHVPGDGEGDD